MILSQRKSRYASGGYFSFLREITMIELFPIKLEDARMYYANEAVKYSLGVRELRKQIQAL